MNTEELSAIIVDNESDAREMIGRLLDDYPEISVVGQAANVAEGKAAILSHQPDIVFLDIEMPGRDGFEIAQEIRKNQLETHIIFITAFNQYAIEAFKVAAFDYLLKPVDPDELKKTILRLHENNTKTKLKEKLDILTRFLNPQKLRFNTWNGFIMVNPRSIIYCEADGNYSYLYLDTGKKEHISQQLGKIEEILNNDNFVRINRSIILNKEFISSFDRKSKIIKLTNVLEEMEFKVNNEVLKLL